MIKAEVDESAISLEVKGNITAILADVSFIISGVYEGLPSHHRETFREVLTHSINDEEGPVWRFEDENH